MAMYADFGISFHGWKHHKNILCWECLFLRLAVPLEMQKTELNDETIFWDLNEM